MIAKLGPWVRTLYSASVSGCPDRLTTHLLLIFGIVPSIFSLVVLLEVETGTVVSSLPCPPSQMFEWPPLFLWHHHSSLDICLILTFMQYASLLRLINILHSSMISLGKTFKRVFIHVSLLVVAMVMILFIFLILSLSRAFSAFLVICLALGVVILLFNLTLTGMRSSFKHLSENIL